VRGQGLPVIGTTLGPYRVLERLGEGGMGEVYLADDTRLHRRVALKVLSAGSSDDATASERLLREARAAARLDHINICTVYDTGEANGKPYIAMQYIEGENLASRIQRKPIGVEEAVAVAVQVAQALAEAHRHGVVHRDIKPQNVMLTPSGHVKVLDFGLAQSVGLVSDQETTAAKLTEAGAIAGTVRYMSPEQLQGKTVDERSDIFSFGTVMYQLLGRAHPFGDGSTAESIAAILAHDPPRLPDAVPSELRRVIVKCLEKDRERRYQTARDLAVDLDALLRALAAGTARVPADAAPVAPTVTPRVRRGPWMAAGFVVVAAAAVVGWALFGQPAAPATVADYIQITNFADSAAAPAISPDGTMVAFIRDDEPFLSSRNIYVKRLPNGEAKQLTNDSRHKYGPQFSPDGNRIVYTAVDRTGWHTWSVPVIGGEITKVLPNAAGLSWIDEQRLLFSEVKGGGLHMGVVTSTATRADHRTIYFPAHERAMAHYSAISPDRKWVLVVEMDKTGGWDACRIVGFDARAPVRLVGPPGACRAAAWSPDGEWMYFAVSDGVASHLWRQSFPDGVPEMLTSGTATDEQGLAIDPGGRFLITSVGSQSSALWLRDSSGDRLLSSEGFADAPWLTRDAKRVYCLLRRVGSSERHLSVIDVATGRTDSVLANLALDAFALSADERSVAYTAVHQNQSRQIWTAALDRSSPPRLIAEGADSVYFGSGDTLVYRALGPHANYLERINRDGSGRQRILERPITNLWSVSPDGTWAVLQQPSDESPTVRSGLESLAVPLSGGEPKRLCGASCRAAWSADERFLFLQQEAVDRTLVVPLPAGRWFPEFPSDGSLASIYWEKRVAGARWLETITLAPGSDPSRYVFVRRDDRRNLFQIPIR
jgi:Tol biopolymer transport system component/tRNA A-37 threonylcarbamoyl transferase component Bud32